MSNSLAGIDARGQELTNTLKNIGKAATAAFSIAKIVEFGDASVQAANQFNKGMKEVFTLLPGISKQSMSAMTNDVKEFSKEMGTLTSETVPALYQALSAGVSQDSVFDFLETANKAAIGGVTNLETAVDGLSSVVNAYGEDTVSASKASDLMFTTVKLGKTTFEELSSSLYNVVPTAVGAGVAFEDVSAALAAMTAQGIPTSVATTQLRQAIVELSKSGTETDKIFRQIAGKGFTDFIAEGNNIQQAFQLLEQYASDTNVGVNDLFGSVEAGNAVLALTGQGTEKFTQSMSEMREAIGATDAAFKTMEEDPGRKWDRIVAAAEVAQINIGNVLIDKLLPIMEWVQDNIDDIAAGAETAFDIIGDAVGKAWKIAEPAVTFIKNNPDVIAVALAGIGSAIISYKVISGISGVAKAIKTFNSAFKASPVGIITAVVGGVVALGSAIQASVQKMKKQNLAEHFGDITLSAEELEDVASRIVRADPFGKLAKSAQAMSNIEKYIDDISSYMSEIDKANWKVSVGLELTETEKEAYRNNITSFISDTQSVLQEKQYQLTLSVDALFAEGEGGQPIKDSINSSFSGYQSELAALGTQLQDAVNAAFEDGLLDIDEAKEIAELKNQMAEMVNQLTAYEFDAQLEVLADPILKGGDLTPESFEALMGKINEQIASASEQYESAYVDISSALKLQLGNGEIDQATYDEAISKAEEELNNRKAELTIKGVKFALDTVSETYGEEAAAAFQEWQTKTETVFQEQLGAMKESGSFDIMFDDFVEISWDNGLSEESKANLSAILDTLKPSVEQLESIKQSYVNAGKPIPGWLASGISSADALGVVTGDVQSIFRTVGGMFNEADPEYAAMMETAMNAGIYVPTEVAAGMQNAEAMEQITAASNGILESMKNTLAQGIKVNVPVEISYSTSGSIRYTATAPAYEQHADGTLWGENAYIAGEEGPELILGRSGSKVFPAKETDRILSAMSDVSPDVPVPEFLTGRYDEYKRSDKNITLEIKGNGKISIDKGASKEEIVTILFEYLKPALLKILAQEIFEEGDNSYEF